MSVDTDHQLHEPANAVGGLAADVAADLSAALGETVVAGSPCDPLDAAELVPPGGGWVAAAEVPGNGLVAIVLSGDVTQRLGSPATTWTQVIDRALAAWAHRHHTAVEQLSPAIDATNIAGLLPSRDGLGLTSCGLFLADHQVGSAALLASAGPEVAPARPAPAGARETPPPRYDLGALRPLAGVEMAVTAELGRAQLPVSELLELHPGSVVELDRPAGGPVDVLVNGTLIARGEVVVVDEAFGVRLTEIVDRDEA